MAVHALELVVMWFSQIFTFYLNEPLNLRPI
jgi:hypothetical protein